MDILGIIIAAVIGLILLVIVIRILRGCLPKIILGMIILGALAYLVYWYFVIR